MFGHGTLKVLLLQSITWSVTQHFRIDSTSLYKFSEIFCVDSFENSIFRGLKKASLERLISQRPRNNDRWEDRWEDMRPQQLGKVSKTSSDGSWTCGDARAGKVFNTRQKLE